MKGKRAREKKKRGGGNRVEEKLQIWKKRERNVV